MPQEPVPHTDLRKAGLAAALVVGLLLAAGLAVVVLTRRPPAVHTPGAKPLPPSGPAPEVPPDIADKGLSTQTAKVQFADKSDPSRAAGMIEWASLEPLSQVEKLLTEPRGYIYLRDGGLILVSSKSGRLNTTPKVEEPQSGRFEGGVTLKLFPAGTDPKTDQPTLTATSESLDFDLPSASIATTGPFHLVSTSFDIDGSGMRLIVNQVEEGIERFEVARVTKAVFRPDAKDPLAARTAAQTTASNPHAKPGGAGLDRLRTYRAVIDGAVNLVQKNGAGPGRTMSAERVEAWAHLVNNKLPPGAVGRFGPEPTPSSPSTTTPATTPAANPSADTTITGVWTGRLVVTPVAEKGENAHPPEFGDNKLALRLHAGQTPVTIHDDSFKGAMTAARVDFGATSRDLALASTPSMPVEINAQGAGKVVAKGAAVNLGTGKVDLTGGGTLTPTADLLARANPTAPTPSTPKPADTAAPPTTLNFDNTLSLQFATAGNFITPEAKSAHIKGGLHAASGEVKADADEATVEFNPPASPGAKTTIKQLRLIGNAVASAPAAATAATLTGTPSTTPKPAGAQRDMLKGQQIAVDFKTDQATGEQQPTRLEVTGNAEATAGGAGENGLNLKARAITADLARDARGQLAVTRAEANDEVHVSDNTAGGPSTFAASANKLIVDPAAGIADLYGAPVTVSRDGAVMLAKEHLKLTQATGEAYVDGEGSISSFKDGDPTKHEETTTAHASWKKSMTFNNTTGKAECVGDATATMTVGETQRNVLQASTLFLQFTPAPKPGERPATPGAAAPQRELITAEAAGELGIDGRPPRPATLEHRKFSMVGGEQKLEQLTYLSGHRILADQTKQTLDVPAAGKLLVDDRTPEPPKPAPAGNAPASPTAPLGGFTSSKGTSLFTWNGSLHLDLIKGEAILKKDVALTHQALPTQDAPNPPQTTLDCDQLTAFLKTNQQAGTPQPGELPKLDATLERVEAVGNVVTKSEGRQLTAHSVIYDPVRGYFEAAGKDGTDQLLATFLDPSRPAPLRARKLTWNQKTGEARVIEPAPTVFGQ